MGPLLLLLLLLLLSLVAVVPLSRSASTAPPPAQRCLPPAQRVDCPGPPGGRAGCLARGCCYDTTKPGHTDWCSHFNHTKPPPPPPPPPSPVVWHAGRNTTTGAERVLVHANGAITLELGDAQWLEQSAPSACINGASDKAAVTVNAGVATNGYDPKLGDFLAYTFSITAPAALRGGFLSAMFWPDVQGSAAFEFSVKLAAAVQPGSGHGECYSQPIISFPFGGRVLQQNASWLTWRGEMVRHAYGSSIQTNTGLGTAPLVLAGTGGATVVVAPADEFLTTQVALTDGTLGVVRRKHGVMFRLQRSALLLLTLVQSLSLQKRVRLLSTAALFCCAGPAADAVRASGRLHLHGVRNAEQQRRGDADSHGLGRHAAAQVPGCESAALQPAQRAAQVRHTKQNENSFRLCSLFVDTARSFAKTGPGHTHTHTPHTCRVLLTRKALAINV